MDKGWGVVIVAAGRGTRMGTTESKQFLLLQDKPVFIHTLEVFAALDEISEIVLVTGAADVERCLDWVKITDWSRVSVSSPEGKRDSILFKKA